MLPNKPDWTIDDAAALYGIRNWGGDNFDLSAKGEVTVKAQFPSGEVAIPLTEIVAGAAARGHDFPLLLRIENLLDSQLSQLNETFAAAIATAGYQGKYQGIFPVKVNQQCQVIEEICRFGQRYGHGLEAGSKAAYTLSPQKEGTYTIAPITFTVNDREYTAEAVTLEVTAATNSVTPRSQAPAQGSAGAAPGTDQSIYITATTDRDTVYVNQQITWTLGYYSDGRVGLLRSPNYSPPAAEGFWVEDLPPQNKYYSVMHGRRYLVNEIKRAYFPTAPGLYTIGEAKVDIVVDEMRRNAFDDFFSRSLRSRSFGDSKTLLTEERRVVVLPLPASGKPEGFAGVVAEDLSLSIVADKQVVQVSEPVNVTIEINGVGNIKTIAPPQLAELDRYKIYESGSKADTFKKDYVVSGRKQYDFVVIPQVEGKWSIPAVELAYFDPVERVYRVARSSAIQLDVQPGTREDGRKVIYAGGGDDIDVISQDIRYIHPVPSALAVATRPLYKNRFYVGLHVLPLLAVVASVFVERRRRRLRDDVAFARSSRALREAASKLALSERLMGGGDVEGGYSALSGAVIGYFSDKMNAPAAGLTSDAIESFLRAGGAGDETIEGVRRLLSDCDVARFAAGGASAATGRDAVARASEALKTIERGVRS